MMMSCEGNERKKPQYNPSIMWDSLQLELIIMILRVVTSAEKKRRGKIEVRIK